MEKCLTKKLLYNSKTKRCYKPCEQKNKDTHPITKKCRQRCKSNKTRRLIDFRCVKNTKNISIKIKKLKKNIKIKKKSPKHDPNMQKNEQVHIKQEHIEASVEQIIPPPLEKKLVKNFKFMDDLINKGKNKRVDYRASLHVSEIIMLYFHEKYKQKCPMYTITTYDPFTEKILDIFKKKNKSTGITFEKYKQALIKKYPSTYTAWDKEKFLKNLKLCLETGEQIIVIPVCIPAHLNMLIIKASTREIIRFEPHGAKYGGEIRTKEIDEETNAFFKKLTDDVNGYLNLKEASRQFKYVEPTKLCPYYKPKYSWSYNEGFQAFEQRNIQMAGKEGAGFCQLWSWFFAECVINNPDMPIKDVYTEAHAALKKDEINFANVIRGYFFSINEELEKMKDKMSIHSDYTNKMGSNDFFLLYLKEQHSKLQNKPRKPFVGGSSNKFVLPPLKKGVPSLTPRLR
jgi:hypothetical protein